jgi:uncharacterized protein
VGQLVVLANPAAAGNPPPTSSDPPPLLHLLPGDPPLVFLINGSQLFEVEPDYFAELCRGDQRAQSELVDFTRVQPSTMPDLALPATNAISLNIAQSCNLSCSYCYADEGRFGALPTMMSFEVARAAIDQLFENSPARRVTVGFIGGEPFLNREVLYSSVAHASARAHETGRIVGFSVTTNGTLLTARDLEFLRGNSFVVTVSLDGSAGINDQNRCTRKGRSAFELAVRALNPLLRHPGGTKIAARATITRADLSVVKRIEALLDVGFREVGVSPLRTSPAPGLALQDQDWPIFLAEMVRAGEQEWQRLLDVGTFSFSNLAIALKQLHHGHCKPLPCGAAASYVSVGARGGYFTCHRTVEDPRFSLGSTVQGLSADNRTAFLRSRHVDLQQPCRGCWARYLCGGGCHAEVMRDGRSGCDYIRGWLEYCLRFYDKALRKFPALFQEN